MEDTHFVEQDDRYAAAFPLANFGSEDLEERFDVLPLNICTRGVSKEEFERALMLSLHVPYGTTYEYHLSEARCRSTEGMGVFANAHKFASEYCSGRGVPAHLLACQEQ